MSTTISAKADFFEWRGPNPPINRANSTEWGPCRNAGGAAIFPAGAVTGKTVYAECGYRIIGF
jgi:hypothetical protein